MHRRILHRAFTTALLVLGGCGLGAYDGSAPLTAFDNFHVLAAGQAYRSAQLDPTTLKLVAEQYGIRTVINLRGASPGEPWYDAERQAAAEAGLTLVDIDMSAQQLPARAELLKLFDTYKSAAYPILIHCQAGADRAGAAAALWRMTIPGDSREAAAAELSPLFGHISQRCVAMDQLVACYQPSREWILNDYPEP